MDDTARSNLLSAINEYGVFRLYSEIIKEKRGEEFHFQNKVDSQIDSSVANIKLRSPFSFSNDKNPSFWINKATERWTDAHSVTNALKAKVKSKGDIIDFYIQMEYDYVNDDVIVGEYSIHLANLLKRFDVTTTESKEFYLMSLINFIKDGQEALEKVYTRKVWDYNTLVDLGVGMDSYNNRLIIPVKNSADEVINFKSYGVNSDTKIYWGEGIKDSSIFPIKQLETDYVVIVEGEPDVLTLRSFGINAVCSHYGGNNPIPSGEWYKGKKVFVLMDDDDKGHEAEQKICAYLKERLSFYYVSKLPAWDGKLKNADISDYVLLYKELTREEIQDKIEDVLRHSVKIQTDILDITSEKEVVFSQINRSENIGEQISFQGKVVGINTQRYGIPTKITCSCPRNSYRFCSDCEMNTVHSGMKDLRIEPHNKIALELFQVSSHMVENALKKHLKIPFQCGKILFSVKDYTDVEAISLTQTSEQYLVDGTTKRIECYIVTDRDKSSLNTGEYSMKGFLYPHPTNQQLIPIITKYNPIIKNYRAFKMTPEIFDTLKMFQPKSTIMNHLKTMANNLRSAVTGINGREDLHILYNCIFHSALNFSIGDTFMNKGWLEALVVGDTRCGKSATYKKLSEWLNSGVIVDCKNATVAGIIGGVESSSLTKDRYIVHGILPQHDGEIVCFDEYTARTGLLRELSSVRSDGTARLVKIQHAEIPARVRAIWIANPGMGRLISDMGIYGVESILKIIEQPEDIARFDVAIVLSQSDVHIDSILELSELQASIYPREAMKLLLDWAWTRNYKTIHIDKDVMDAAITITKMMITKYSNAVPLVETADQKNKLLRMAVSVAIQCFSTDDGENVIVTKDHLFVAEKLFSLFYDKPSMGYDKYSRRKSQAVTKAQVDSLHTYIVTTYKTYAPLFIENMLNVDTLNRNIFAMLAPIESDMVMQRFLTYLTSHGYFEFIDASNFRRTHLLVQALILCRERENKNNETNLS